MHKFTSLDIDWIVEIVPLCPMLFRVYIPPSTSISLRIGMSSGVMCEGIHMVSIQVSPGSNPEGCDGTALQRGHQQQAHLQSSKGQ